MMTSQICIHIRATTIIPESNIVLSRLENQHSNLSKIEVNEVLCLMSDIRPKVSTNNNMPRWVIFLIKLFLYVSRDILFDVVF
mmetsp:Transcript_8254/g.12284  ORF Transcript_8254/g.12284 Transcript_8254/m.12284 type:complete len:83 (+) Transcript_8254:166-414(+)